MSTTYSPAEVAEMLGIQPGSIYAKIRRKTLDVNRDPKTGKISITRQQLIDAHLIPDDNSGKNGSKKSSKKNPSLSKKTDEPIVVDQYHQLLEDFKHLQFRVAVLEEMIKNQNERMDQLLISIGIHQPQLVTSDYAVTTPDHWFKKLFKKLI